MTLGAVAGIVRHGDGVRTGQQLRRIGVVHEARLQPALVARVLEQSAHQVRHARNHLPDRHVLAHAQPQLGGRALQLVGHAVQHLQFDRARRQAQSLGRGQRRRDAARVVAAQRQLHATFACALRCALQEDALHALEARVGERLLGPHGAGPTLLLGVDGLVVPVRALHQSHGHHATGALAPLHHAARVVVAALQVGLHGQTRVEGNLLAAAHEQLQREVLQRELLHVEVDQHAALLRRLQDRAQSLHQAADRAFGVDRIGARVQRADLDAHVHARNGAQVIALEACIRGPAGHLRGQVVDQVQVLLLVGRGFLVAHARLAQQVHAEGQAFFPHLPKLGQRSGRVGARDELAGHARDLVAHGLGHQTLRQTARLQAKVKARRRLHARLGQVVHQMLVHRVGGAQHGEGVHKAEQLHLERLVLHAPFHQLVRPERRAEHALGVVARAVEQVQALGVDQRLQRRVGGGDAGARRCGGGIARKQLGEEAHGGADSSGPGGWNRR